jgi:NAD(P)-dependent dehydrogenase (short-subunit alcohol dehydrogenase family)
VQSEHSPRSRCDTHIDKVTFSNSSAIGFHIAHQLALKGAKVYVGARSTQKAQDAISEMRQQTPALNADRLRPFVMDLGDLKQVQKVAKNFISVESRLDILVNNAGL